MKVTTGTTVTVPNGEVGVVVDVFRKDGEDRVEVQFSDGTTLVASPEVVTVAAA